MSIEVKDAYSGYSDVDIIRGFSMRVEEGTITGLIGPNGCGKSTLCKTIYGILRPKKGKIYHDGDNITGLSPHQMLRRGISYIPQARNIFPHLSVRENLKIGAWILRNERVKVRESIEETYERFPILKVRANIKASSLSGGEQKMLEFGRALITDPTTLLVDEPTAGLAPKIAHEVYNSLGRLKEEFGLTILLVDQNVRAAITFSDYLYTMELGKNIEEGSREKFQKSMKSLVSSWIK